MRMHMAFLRLLSLKKDVHLSEADQIVVKLAFRVEGGGTGREDKHSFEALTLYFINYRIPKLAHIICGAGNSQGPIIVSSDAGIKILCALSWPLIAQGVISSH